MGIICSPFSKNTENLSCNKHKLYIHIYIYAKRQIRTYKINRLKSSLKTAKNDENEKTKKVVYFYFYFTFLWKKIPLNYLNKLRK